MEFNNLYLTFEEYQGLGGTLEEMPFNILEFKAQKLIDKPTFGRLKELETQVQEVKLCIYDLISILNEYDKVLKKADISSENTDGYSVSYEKISKEQVESFKLNIKECIKDYLIDCKLEDGTPYLYCGGD